MPSLLPIPPSGVNSATTTPHVSPSAVEEEQGGETASQSDNEPRNGALQDEELEDQRAQALITNQLDAVKDDPGEATVELATDLNLKDETLPSPLLDSDELVVVSREVTATAEAPELKMDGSPARTSATTSLEPESLDTTLENHPTLVVDVVEVRGSSETTKEEGPDNETALLRTIDHVFEHVVCVTVVYRLAAGISHGALDRGQRTIVDRFKDAFSYDDPITEKKSVKKVTTAVNDIVDPLHDFIDPKKGGPSIPDADFKEKVEQARRAIKSAMLPGWEKWV